jgi:hypothetical protein
MGVFSEAGRVIRGIQNIGMKYVGESRAAGLASRLANSAKLEAKSARIYYNTGREIGGLRGSLKGLGAYAMSTPTRTAAIGVTGMVGISGIGYGLGLRGPLSSRKRGW